MKNTISPQEPFDQNDTSLKYEPKAPPVSFQEAIANMKFATEPHTFTDKKWKKIKARRKLANASKKQNRHNGK